MQSFFSRDWDSSYFNIFPASQGLLTSLAFLSTNSDISQLLLASSYFPLPAEVPEEEEDSDDPAVTGSNHSIWPFLREPLLQAAPLSSPSSGGYRGVRIPIDVSSSAYVESDDDTSGCPEDLGEGRILSDEELMSGAGTGVCHGLSESL